MSGIISLLSSFWGRYLIFSLENMIPITSTLLLLEYTRLGFRFAAKRNNAISLDEIKEEGLATNTLILFWPVTLPLLSVFTLGVLTCNTFFPRPR